KRQLVDCLRRLSANRRVVVIRSIDVGGVVGAEAHECLDRPALAVAQQLRTNSEHRFDLRGTGGVVGVGDLGPEQLRQIVRTRLDRVREVDEIHPRTSFLYVIRFGLSASAPSCSRRNDSYASKLPSNQRTSESPSNASTCVAIRSRNQRSCETTTAQPANASSASSS